MTSVSILPGDNRKSLAAMPENSVDSVVTDPPYGLVSVVKRFGKSAADDGTKTSERITNRTDGFARVASGGFMGKIWDGSGIETDPEFWALVLRVLKPGGYIVAFSSSRTYHRTACAIEDAGFITHPMIGWLNGQGFPKAHAADKAIDKFLRKAGEVVAQGEPVKRMIPGADQHRDGSWIKDNGREYQPGQYMPATEEAAKWAGWAYGGQVRKPSLEPIYVGQKPFSEKSGAANLLKHGVGAVNIDGCRVPLDLEHDDPRLGGKGTWGTGKAAKNVYEGGYAGVRVASSDKGRHPANIIHDGSPEVVALFPDSKGQQGDVRGTEKSRTGDENTNCYGEYGRVPAAKRNDSGSAARFFESYPFEDQPAFYHAKASKDDRAGSRHPTVKPIALMAALVRHITPPGGVVLDPFAGSGTTGEAAKREGFDCILMEAEPEYIDFLHERFENQSLVNHDTRNCATSDIDDLDDLLG